ncbi:MAG: PIN domain-containing protein [Pirellulales bacterium]|nr:PIN domain-containing protein [Pirellulales bacterium]
MLTAATVLELVKGLQRAGRPDRIPSLLKAMAAESIFPIDHDAAVIAGQIYGDLERTGQTIGRIDPLVAGVAIHRGLVLVTGNTKHFERVVRLGCPLRLDNWRR